MVIYVQRHPDYRTSLITTSGRVVSSLNKRIVSDVLEIDMRYDGNELLCIIARQKTLRIEIYIQITHTRVKYSTLYPC